MLTTRRRPVLYATIVPAALIALALSLAGCSASGSSESSLAGGAPITAPGGASGADVSAGTSESSSNVVKRQIVTTGKVVIRAKNPIAAADDTAKIVDSAGGRVDDRTQTAATKSAPADATLTLRIPSARLTPTLTRLKSIGDELSITESTDDVTTASEDLGARIDALRTSITRLLALESKATNTADVITLENDISDRQGQLESLTAQQRTLDDQVAMSTITVHIIAPSTPVPTSGPPSAASAFFAGLSGFGVFFTWAFLVLTYLLPWLILGAVIWIGIVLLLRMRRRRRAAAVPLVVAVPAVPPVPATSPVETTSAAPNPSAPPRTPMA